ncbi:MAG: heme-binding domain-containing protein, partial [Bacteroidales bacterium]|nr:heme-binding domain-containing protein [Bacteroidales bacterium]
EGRQHVNFSEWGNYPAGRRGHKNDACKEMIEKKEMPIKPYLLMHPEARLSEDQYAKLVSWFTNE